MAEFLDIEDFLETLKRSHFSLGIENEKLVLKGDRKKLSKEQMQAITKDESIISYIRENKSVLLDHLSSSGNENHNNSFKQRKNVASIYRLSGLQQGMLFHGLYDSTNGAYIEQFYCDLLSVDIVALHKSWAAVIKNHTSLRTGFYYNEFNVPVQVVYHEVKMPVSELDYTEKTPSAREADFKEILLADKAKGFDFGVVPLMRLTLIKLSETDYRMLWTSHHILFDGWSLPILMEEFLSTYDDLVNGKEPIQRQEDSYQDYIRYIENIDKEQEKTYWSNYMQGLEEPTLLPFIESTSERTKGAGLFLHAASFLDESVTSSIQAFAQKNHLTINTLVQGVWALLLHKYTSKENIVYGVTVSGRPDDLPSVESRVGLYINTIPLHSKIDENGDQDLILWLQQLQQSQVASRNFQYTGLQDIQSWNGMKGDFFDTLLVFENYPVSELIAAKKWSLQVENVNVNEQTNYPLTIIVSIGKKLGIDFSYNSALLDNSAIDRIKGHFINLLLKLANNKLVTLSKLKILTEAEEQQLLDKFNEELSGSIAETTVADLFRKQAIETPGNLALVYKDERLSFRELDEQSNRIAAYLRSKGVQAGMFVPICIERSIAMVTAILGILKTGAAYVPVDPSYPAARISFMLEDTAASIVLTSDASEDKIPSVSGIEIISLDKASKQISAQSSEAPDVKLDPNGIAYLIYTSGSTGKPKGVMIAHHNLLHYLLNEKTRYVSDTEKGSGSFVHLSFTFDASLTAMFMPLLFGRPVVISSKEALEVFEDENLLKYAPYDFIKATPAHLALLEAVMVNESGELLTNKLVVGGEALHYSHFDFMVEQGLDVDIINEYGPTEATVGCSTYVFNTLADKEKIRSGISIGKPVSNTRIYILNDQQELLPLGVSGEICIGGGGIGLGYLNREDLSAVKFVADPFSIGGRMYRTGDLGRWKADGNIEYLGRLDDQVKVRGYRIELGEIESVLLEHESVKQAVVMAKPDNESNNRLTAYVVHENGFFPEQLKSFLSSKLPQHMIPELWVEMQQLPLTSNGKVDKKALPEPGSDERLREYVAPGSESELKLSAIFQSLLGLERIGIHENFFEIGGHSLLAIRLVSRLRKELGVEVNIRTLFSHPTIASLSKYIFGNNISRSLTPIEVRERPVNIPLSYSQERLWFINKLEGSVAYHVPAAMRLKGKLDVNGLENAIRQVVNRHEILRTIYQEENNKVSQVIQPKDQWVLSISEGQQFDSEASLQVHMNAIISKPFGLESDHMIRAEVICIAEDEYLLVFVMHHIASDGWSIPILIREVAELYNAEAEERPAFLPAIRLQYSDYAIWQRQTLNEEALNSKLGYWKQKLNNTTTLQLPVDKERPAKLSNKGSVTHFEIDPNMSVQLQSLAKQNGATVFMVMAAAYNILLQRYSNQNDIIIGMPVANRTQEEIEGLIGFFINTLALRTELNPTESFIELLSKIKTNTLEAYEHQDVPFEKVVEAVVKDRDLSRSPLFQVILQYDKVNENLSAKGLKDISLTLDHLKHENAKFELSLFIIESSRGLKGSFEYNTELFTESTIQKLSNHFRKLLSSIVSTPTEEIAKLKILTEAEEQQLLDKFNEELSGSIAETTVADLFRKQAIETPGNLALVYKDERLSFRELDEQSNRIAAYLRSKGVQAGMFVPICIERSMAMVTAILGILKTGAAYVPVDPSYPAARISFMLEDTAASIVLTSDASEDKIPSVSGIEIISLDKASKQISAQSSEAPDVKLDPNGIAYLIYTSGSTGKPKGVMIAHHNLLHYLLNEKTRYVSDTEKGSGSFVHLSFTFDASLTAMFMPLLFGRPVVISSKEALEVFEDENLLKYAPYDFIKATPAHLALLEAVMVNESGELLTNKLVVGGEALHYSHFDFMVEQGLDVDIINEYGPTEATVGCSTYVFNTLADKEKIRSGISIGKPVSNTRIYILNDQQELLPLGVSGEICIGGGGIGLGYLNREDLSAVKFVADPFSIGGRMYRTGDLGRWKADGNIEYLGRLDDQVKVRGYRIELGEIESVLLEHESVKQAVVMAKPDKLGDTRLVAYLKLREGYSDIETLSSYIKEKLPEFMIPSTFVEVDEFLLTSNGKIDKKSLPDGEEAKSTTGEFVAAGTPTEIKLAEIWQEVLEEESIGINDNFFQLGGHSLLAIRLIAYVRKEMEVELSIMDLFTYPTIAKLAKYIDTSGNNNTLPSIPSVTNYPSNIPLSFSQERLWFIDRMEGSLQYHIPVVIRLKGKVSIENLESSFLKVIDRHKILRTVYHEDQGNVSQALITNHQWTLVNTSGKQYRNDQQGLNDYISKAIRKPFALDRDFMLRAELIKISDDDFILLVVVHHIASDGASMPILISEMIEVYSALTASNEPVLSSLDIQYADYALWQRDYIKGEVLSKELNFWNNQLAGVTPIELPVDFERPSIITGNGALSSFVIDKDVATSLRKIAADSDATLFMAVLAAFKLLLHKYTGQQDIVVGTPVSGRYQQEVENLVGFFVNTIALRSDVNGKQSFKELLENVKQVTLESYDHQYLPFEKVVEAVVSKRDLSRSPVFQVMIIFENQANIETFALSQLADIELSTEDFTHQNAKFELSLFVKERDGELQAAFEYNTDLFKTKTIEKMVDDFNNLLLAVVQNPSLEFQNLLATQFQNIDEGKAEKRKFSGRSSVAISVPVEYAEPKSDTEIKLAAIFRKLLALPRVGLYDDFFELGGHSLIVMRLISQVRKIFKVELSIRSIFINPTVQLLSGHIEQIAKGFLIPAIEVSDPRPDHIPLSFSQERLWFIDKLEGTVQYHIPATLRLTGYLDQNALENSFKEIVNRHEVLRTVFPEHENGVHQLIKPPGDWRMNVIHREHYATDNEIVKKEIKAFISRPFSLLTDDMIRVQLIVVAADEYLLTVVMHHIAADGWSMPILIHEITQLYNSFTNNQPSLLPHPNIQYVDYAIWQRKYLHFDKLKNKVNYWKSKLLNIEPLQLPLDYQRPTVMTSNGDLVEFTIEKNIADGVIRIGRENSTTLFMTMLAAFNTILYRYTGQQDIVVGTPVANRGQEDIETLIGFFVNTLVLRTEINPGNSFLELLQLVKATTLEAYEHQDLPFEKLVEAVSKTRDMSRSPVFQVMLVVQNEMADEGVALLDGIDVTVENLEQQTSKFELGLYITETKDGLKGAVEYNTDLFQRRSIENFTEHFQQLLESVVMAPDQQVVELKILSVAEEKMLLSDFSGVEINYPRSKTVVGIFEEQVAKYPDNIAISLGDQEINYSDLNMQANRLAGLLIKKGITSDTLVPVCIDRSINMIVSMLAVLKAGGAYVPVDPDYPEDRIAYMIGDTAARIVISTETSKRKLNSISGIEIISVDEDAGMISRQSGDNLKLDIQPNGAAYVIYTSGSTGKPKGVIIEHRNVVRLFFNDKALFDFNDKDVWSLFHSFSFDFSVWEMYGALFYGGRIVLVPKEVTRDVSLFADLLINEGVTVLNQTPSAFYVLQEQMLQKTASTSIRYVIFGGEALNLSRLRPWKKVYRGSKLVNMYGITETTVHVTYKEIEWQDIEDGRSNIGKPIPTLRAFILDERRQPVPVGVPGELYIAGDGLARAYLNRAQLTAERFIANHITEKAGDRLYKTGDLGRWLTDGSIEYLGRIDEQVKIRGYRIELGEIETVLLETKMVSQGVVVAMADGAGSKRLVSYVVPSNEYSKEAAKEYISKRLPDYMVPQVWVEMESLPLTSNGKINRKALPEPSTGDLSSTTYVAPGNETEQKLAEIWQQLLNIEKAGIHDNFFELGGHSLLAMRLLSQLKNQFNKEVAIKELFRNPTIKGLAALLAESISNSELSIAPVTSISPRPERIPLSFSQERLWFIDKLEGSIQYHIPAAIRLYGEPDLEALNQAFVQVIDRHEVLKTIFLEEEGKPFQSTRTGDGWVLSIIEADAPETDLKHLISKEVAKPFNLSTDYMIRANLFLISDKEFVLLVTVHHIAADAWSLPILINEITNVYNALINQCSPQLPELKFQYADYAWWQHQYLSGDRLDNKLDYWINKLDGVSPLQLVTDKPRPAVQTSNGAVAEFELGKEITGGLQMISRQFGSTLFMTVLSVFKILLHRYSGQSDITVGTPIANRQQAELENLVGFFVNTLALRSEITAESTFRSILQSVKATTLEAYEHQEVPFEKVVEKVVKTRDLSRSPLFQVMFVLQNQANIRQITQLNGLEVVEEKLVGASSKFDLMLFITESDAGLKAAIEYNTDLFERSTIDRMISHFDNLTSAVLQNPDAPLSEIKMISWKEEQKVISVFNDTSIAFPNYSIIDLFEQQVRRTPAKPAVVFHEKQITYSELNASANRLAQHIQHEGVKPGDLVPVSINRSIEMIIAVIATLKAGAAYVPIDPEYPAERKAYMLKDTAAKLIITNCITKNEFKNDSGLKIISVDDDIESANKVDSENLSVESATNGIAYLLYTSGSTGKPKAVKMPGSSLVNLLYWQDQEFKNKDRRVLQFASLNFDVSFQEIFSTLCFGSTLYLLDEDERKDAGQLLTLITKHRLTHLFMPYIVFQNLAEYIISINHEGHFVEQVIVAGEQLKLSSEIKELLNKFNVSLVNQYGPTEAHVVSCYYVNNDDTESQLPPIGKPIANTRLYINDVDGQPAAVGVPGELYIAGVQVADGYLNLPELTTERFIADIYSNVAGSKMYKTGDQARWLPDGNIEYRGRIDEQVKIRGYRIELGEIEAVIQQSESIRQSVVIVRKDDTGSNRLIAYVVPEDGFNRQKVSEFVASKLPAYMVPAIWVELINLPVTKNGKVDKRQLPDPDASHFQSNEYAAPENEVQEKLVSIWQQLLKVENIGIRDNFFELGGHSLLAMRVLSMIHKELGVELAVKDLFQCTSINDLSKYVEIQLGLKSQEKNLSEYDVLVL